MSNQACITLWETIQNERKFKKIEIALSEFYRPHNEIFSDLIGQWFDWK